MVIWPWTWKRSLEYQLLRASNLERKYLAQQEASERWKSRYLSANDEASKTRLTLTTHRETWAAERGRLSADNEWRRHEIERLQQELLESGAQVRMLIEKIGVPAPARDPKVVKKLLDRDDPFAEDESIPSVFVDRPGATPAEIGDEIAEALPGA